MNGALEVKAPSSNLPLSEDDLYWMAVDIILNRYKSVTGRDIAKLAEGVTAEAVPPGLSSQGVQGVLSRRIHSGSSRHGR